MNPSKCEKPNTPAGPGHSMSSDAVVMTATEARRAFGRVLRAVARGETVLITRGNVPHAYVLPADRCEPSPQPTDRSLETLTAEFDAMLERMQGPEAEAAIQAAFSSPQGPGRPALAACRAALR